MKKHVTVLVAISIISLITMGFRSSSGSYDSLAYKTVTIVKGEVYDADSDKDWDLFTFGLEGFKPNKHTIESVEIFDENGASVALIDNLDVLSTGDVWWFSADLSDLDVPDSFTVEIHVVKGKWSGLLLASAAQAPPPPAPNDPEETILIVKYP